ncbi:branched-chain amino acid ABC transporter permease [Effusibacillus lacus]|uniref:ABC transporter permease n=1 Tax=Effusibacillus lacus TaxID=1348429 RepID=A0A292YK24_9BACL|nr:branched-chain amino acid ABC transporter permease [Effusibacillus lacus]TCS72812.1 amino acid/amide ABC transporter membrane protein 2 (HAAT family) [Effusibacillus lacus]GAX89261.1 ABC transporter permease [Effusibacillus lacus]
MKRYLPVLILLTAMSLLPIFASNPYILHSLIMILFYAYLATSWNIVGGFAGQLSLGHSAFMAVGGYTSTLLFIYLDLSPWIGMFVGGLAAALVAVFIGIPSFRLRGAYYSIATIAFAEGLSVILETVKEIGPVHLGAAEGIMVPLKVDAGFFDFQFLSKVPYYYIILVFLSIVILVSWYIERSKLGFYLTALREDEEAAKALGIHTQRVKLVAAGISAFFTAIGGTFFAQLIRYLEPATIAGFDLSAQMVFLAIVGGLGTVFGPFVGAILLTTVGEITRVSFGDAIPGMHLVLYGIAVALVMLYCPKGILDPLQKLFRFGFSKKNGVPFNPEAGKDLA